MEIELTGITRAKAAGIIAGYFHTTQNHTGGHYDEYQVKDTEERTWKLVSDASIHPKKKVGEEIQPATDLYKVEMVSPKLNYKDIESLQELIRR